jgi:hypothetical protein
VGVVVLGGVADGVGGGIEERVEVMGGAVVLGGVADGVGGGIEERVEVMGGGVVVRGMDVEGIGKIAGAGIIVGGWV